RALYFRAGLWSLALVTTRTEPDRDLAEPTRSHFHTETSPLRVERRSTLWASCTVMSPDADLTRPTLDTLLNVTSSEVESMRSIRSAVTSTSGVDPRGSIGRTSERSSFPSAPRAISLKDATFSVLTPAATSVMPV